MGDLDDDTVVRVARWCAEAGRHAGAAEIRAALGGLGRDEILALRAVVADPPPARPLGPFALADIVRGAPADIAAERERAGRYRPEPRDAAPDGGSDAGPRTRASPRGKGRARASVLVRRAADRSPEPARAPAPAARPRLADLFLPEGRSVLERLLRRLGGRRAAIAAELEATRDAPGGVGDRELDALLEHHGLATLFAHRERDEILHALRAEAGSLERAGARVGLDPAAFEVALARLGATGEAERIRDERRAELRRRSTLTDRVGAVLGDEARLRDLGLLAEFEADLGVRLPEHVRALRAAGESAEGGLARTLSLGPAQAAALVARFGLEARPDPRRGPGAPALAPARTPPPRPGARPARRRASPGTATPGRAWRGRGPRRRR
jgi:hypothetical protein